MSRLTDRWDDIVCRIGAVLSFLFVALLIVTWWQGCVVAPDAIPPEPADQRSERVGLEGVDGERSGQWRTVREAFVEDYPVCEACGTDEDLNVHHVIPFHRRPDLELERSNLITLCREHHFRIGHDPDGRGPRGPNWKLSNPRVRADAAEYRMAN